MAYIVYDFNLPKASAKWQALESKASIRRYLEEVLLRADERSIVEGDQAKVEGFIRKLQGMSTAEENSIQVTKTLILDFSTLSSLLFL